MKATLQYTMRQSGRLASFCFIWALCMGAEVCQGLWQGGGLHGYVISCCARGGGPRVFAVWTAFIQALTALALACAFFVIGPSSRAKRVERANSSPGFSGSIRCPDSQKEAALSAPGSHREEEALAPGLGSYVQHQTNSCGRDERRRGLLRRGGAALAARV